MRSTFFRSPAPANTLVISYYPLSGNDDNTGPRYQEEAKLTGFDILGITREGSDTYWPDRQQRKRLSVDAFDKTMVADAEALNELAEGYDRVIMRGQSTGSFPSLAVLKTGRVRVTHLLIEDGINTRRSATGLTRGRISSRLDWLRYGQKERAYMPKMDLAPQAVPARQPMAQLKSAIKFCVEQYHWAPLWRSTYSKDSLLEVALTKPQLPISIKFLGHTATTTAVEVDSLRRELEGLGNLRRERGLPTARLHTDYSENSWHGFLTDPKFGAHNLTELSRFISYVD